MYYIILRPIKEHKKGTSFLDPRANKIYYFDMLETIVLVFDTEEVCLDYFKEKRDYWRRMGYNTIVAYGI